MSTIERVILGCIAGFVAVLSKFLAQDYVFVVANASNLTAEQILSYKIGYGLLTPILVLMGGFIAWVSEETKRMKVAALAISAPALVTTWAGGTKPSAVAYYDLFLQSAYAQDARSAVTAVHQDGPQSAKEVSTFEQIQKGVGVFFGYGKEPVKYRVVVGSFEDRDEAQRFADKVNKENSRLNAWVAERRPGNKYFPVVVGEYNYLSKANDLKKEALGTKSIKNAYLSAEPTK